MLLIYKDFAPSGAKDQRTCPKSEARPRGKLVRVRLGKDAVGETPTAATGTVALPEKLLMIRDG